MMKLAKTIACSLIASAVTFGVSSPAYADRPPVICGMYQITVMHVQGNTMECFLRLGPLAHIRQAQCAPRPMRILGGRVFVSGMGEVTGAVDLQDRKKRVKARVRGYMTFTGQLTLGLQKDGDWQVHGLIGYGRVKPTCNGPTTNIFSEDFDE